MTVRKEWRVRRLQLVAWRCREKDALTVLNFRVTIRRTAAKNMRAPRRASASVTSTQKNAGRIAHRVMTVMAFAPTALEEFALTCQTAEDFSVKENATGHKDAGGATGMRLAYLHEQTDYCNSLKYNWVQSCSVVDYIKVDLRKRMLATVFSLLSFVHAYLIK
eukprot:635865_1